MRWMQTQCLSSGRASCPTHQALGTVAFWPRVFPLSTAWWAGQGVGAFMVSVSGVLCIPHPSLLLQDPELAQGAQGEEKSLKEQWVGGWVPCLAELVT